MNSLIQISIILLVYVVSANTVAQSLSSSPYSMYGIGQYETAGNGKNASMGEIGIGMFSDEQLNLVNPASLASLKKETFYFDMGVTLKNSIYYSGGNTESVTEGNFNRMAIGFKPTNRLGISIGFLPVTSIGYKIKTQQYIEGTSQTESISFNGEGGISKFFVGGGWQLSPAISLGATTSLLFGSIKNSEQQAMITVAESSYMRDFYFEGGFQFKEHFNDNMPLTFGLIYGSGKKLSKDNELKVYGSDGATTILEESLPASYGYLPKYIGIGVYSGYGEKWQFGSDFLFQDWSRNISGVSSISFVEVKKLNAGVQYVPSPRNAANMFEQIRYRAGFSIENSYLKIRGQNPLIYNFTAGFGVPLRGSSMLNLAVAWKYDTMASRNNNIQTSSINFTLGISFSESWFLKRQFE